jgi:hypothetical protein
MEQAAGVIDSLKIARDLRAQETARGWMTRVSRDFDGAAVFDLDQHGAGIGAIVRASRVNYAFHTGYLRTDEHTAFHTRKELW